MKVTSLPASKLFSFCNYYRDIKAGAKLVGIFFSGVKKLNIKTTESKKQSSVVIKRFVESPQVDYFDISVLLSKRLGYLTFTKCHFHLYSICQL